MWLWKEGEVKSPFFNIPFFCQSEINGSKNFVSKVFTVFKISQGAKHRSRNL